MSQGHNVQNKMNKLLVFVNRTVAVFHLFVILDKHIAFNSIG